MHDECEGCRWRWATFRQEDSEILQATCRCRDGEGSHPCPKGEAARPSQLPSQPARPPPPPHYGCAPEFGTGQAPTNAGMAHRGVVKMLALSVALALGTAGWV